MENLKNWTGADYICSGPMNCKEVIMGKTFPIENCLGAFS